MKDINTLKIQKYYKKYSNKKFHNTILNFLKPTATELDLEKVSGTTNNVFKITENDTILGFNKQLPFNENSNFNLAYSAREIIGVSLMDAMNHIIPEDSYMSFYKGNFDAASHQYFSKNVGKHGDLNNIFLDAMGSFAQENSENFNTQKTDYVKEQLETIFSTLVEGQLLDYNETNILNLSLDKYLTKFSKFQNQGYTLADVVDKYQCKSQYMKIKKSLHNLKDFIETIESNQEEKIYALSAINLFIFFIEKTEKLREMAPFIGDIRDKNVVPEINEGGNFVKFHIIDFWVDLDRLTKEINSNKGKFDKVLETFTHNFLKHSSQHFISSLLNLEDQFVKFNGHPISKTWGEVFQEFLTTVGQERWDVAMKQVFEETRQNLNSNILQKLTFEDFIEFMEKRKKEKSSQLDRDDVPTLYTKQQMDLFFLTKKQEHKQQIQPKKLKLEDAWRRITLKQKHTYNPYTAKKVFKFGDQFNSAINANQKRDPIRNLDSKQLETQKALQE